MSFIFVSTCIQVIEVKALGNCGISDSLHAEDIEDTIDMEYKDDGAAGSETSDNQTSNHSHSESGEPEKNTGDSDDKISEEGVTFDPIELNARDRTLTVDVEGTVKMLDVARGFGFLKANLPDGYKKISDVYFRFDRVRNVGKERFRLRRGSTVSEKRVGLFMGT